MDLDKETLPLLHRASAFARIIRQTEWGEAKNDIIESIEMLNRINPDDLKLSADELKFKLSVNAEIARILYNWIGNIETLGSTNYNPQTERDYFVDNSGGLIPRD